MDSHHAVEEGHRLREELDQRSSRLLQLRGELESVREELERTKAAKGTRVVEVQVFNDVMHGVDQVFNELVVEKQVQCVGKCV